MGKAIAYSLQLWTRLENYQAGNRQNRVENKIPPPAIGRKNYRLAGSHESAELAIP
jgi:hypothetical protein